jgi:hypothetical protein
VEGFIPAPLVIGQRRSLPSLRFLLDSLFHGSDLLGQLGHNNHRRRILLLAGCAIQMIVVNRAVALYAKLHNVSL